MDAIRMIGIVKCFGPVRANDGIDLIVGQQEIHCLLGENGTGKSTLMNILFGLYHPDAGEIFINEKKAAIANPNDAYALGIGMVHEHIIWLAYAYRWQRLYKRREDREFQTGRSY